MSEKIVRDAISYLERDVLRNITPLKMLMAHLEATRVVLAPSGDGVLILLQADAFDYDRQTYPDADWVVLISSSSAQATRELLAFIPRDAHIVFKLGSGHFEGNLKVVQDAFVLERTRGFLSFTTPPGVSFQADPDVTVTLEPENAVWEMFATQGHSRDWLEPQLRSGTAFACVLKRDGLARSACFAFRNHAHVYEIGGVFTAPESRGQGLAAHTVGTALAELETRLLIPRYQVSEDNIASIRLAQSLGLEHFLTITHWVTA